MIQITDSNMEKIRKFKHMLSSSYYADGGEVTEVYNEVFGRHERPTNCGTCIRQRMVQLVGAMEAIERRLEEVESKANDVVKKEDNDGSKEEGKTQKGKKSRGKH